MQGCHAPEISRVQRVLHPGKFPEIYCTRDFRGCTAPETFGENLWENKNVDGRGGFVTLTTHFTVLTTLGFLFSALRGYKSTQKFTESSCAPISRARQVHAVHTHSKRCIRDFFYLLGGLITPNKYM